MPEPRRSAVDVVIVGAGTAGCTLAARLSDDPARHVVLLEAGPGGADASLTGVDYLAAAEPARFWMGVDVERVAGQPARPYASGRGLGGSAAVNGMVAMPPGADDVQRWVDAGCPAWTWPSVAATVERVAAGWTPAALAELGTLEHALAAACATTGLASFQPLALERSGQRRSSVVERLLGPALDRPNLHVESGLAVRRVLIEGDRALGVELVDGRLIEAREVVLAAGAIRSPLLLAASGLREQASGGRLTDHPSATLTLRLAEGLPVSAFQTAGIVRWRTPSGALAEVLPIARVGEGMGALAVALMDPVSTGSITFRADGSPSVALGLLDSERDRVAMREAIEGALALLATPPLRAITDEVLAGDLGWGTDRLEAISDADLDTWVAATGPYLHAACSLPMGTVLDQWGRVRGVVGLRVVDASSLPTLPPLAPNGTVTVVASHVAVNWSAG